MTSFKSLKDAFNGFQESFLTNTKRLVLRVRLFHLKFALILLPCLFIPMLILYSRDPDDLSYLDVDARNAEIYKRWLRERFKKQGPKTVAPFHRAEAANFNEELFHHWAAQLDVEEDARVTRKKIFKKIIMDGSDQKVIIGELKNKEGVVPNVPNANDVGNAENINAIPGIAGIAGIGEKAELPKDDLKPPAVTKLVTAKPTPKPTPPIVVPIVVPTTKKKPAPAKVILLWNEVYSKHGYLQFKKCPYKNCYITTDKTKLDTSHAVIFNMAGQTPVRQRELKQLPRNPNQSWIFYQRESQVRPLTSDPVKSFNGMFNLTMTFKRTSDIWQPYYHYKLRQEVNRIQSNFATGKTKMVAWLLGNCNEDSIPSNRMMYFKKLQKHIQADLYSNCPGGIPCDNDCITAIYRDYKFIFAAESALCSDFATANTWKPLSSNIVPIVLGLGNSNYSSLLPPKSFIDVKDYNSTEQLAAHLKKVAASDKLYNFYFQWKRYYELGDSHVGFCKLCTDLHQKPNRKNVHHHLEDYWNKEKDCVSHEDYYRGHL